MSLAGKWIGLLVVVVGWHVGKVARWSEIMEMHSVGRIRLVGVCLAIHVIGIVQDLDELIVAYTMKELKFRFFRLNCVFRFEHENTFTKFQCFCLGLAVVILFILVKKN